ncbi:MAG: peptide ABC transporter permease [Rhodobacteraceae bacterium]|jgi:peptide/nickel transport system permease protein|uniref:Peptide/nickel transport system permease protein n=1 Tax=Salipiger profundus TaxID=1229727 RepID=A0A1U7D7Q5_9RHOB|nr:MULTISPECIES: dipeptide/oligopeptide/nickel ABC transporter permease/ATP-binding protein [Salipiger]APX24142.1 peptide/nickel transport system permease protein [Salipiger profundus]MAB06928.1 peptide ABC transporter permease [Paracoccaceae bacterium]GFZ94925.1 peptide ABC transporter permease [Salipiger profundus]SFB89906.1 peptide/nickel transport system permease protein [Salipiger profundus]
MSRSTRKLILPGAIVVLIVAAVVLAPVLPLQDVRAMDIPNRFAGPSGAHWLGQDEFGRDVLSRLIWGGRASLFIAVGSAIFAAIAGTTLGLLGGYFRGVVELFTVRAAEIILCLPPLLLALLVVTILGAGTWPLILALTILYTPNYARVVYAATQQVRGLDFVTAQRAMGTHPLKILVRTILPNVLPPLLVQMSLVVASAMVIESGLSFLGLGVVPPTPSWGLMIRAARGAMEVAPLLLVWPSLALAGTILTFNLLCDRLQSALDPRAVTAGGALWLRPRSKEAKASAPAPQAEADAPLLQIDDMSIAVNDLELVRRVSLTVRQGETVALVGESGSGKTLTGLAMTGLLPDMLRVTGGSAMFHRRDGSAIDLAKLDEEGIRTLRGDEVSMVFQDAAASLNPVLRIGEQVAEAIQAHHALDGTALQARVVDLLRHVGIPDPERRARAYPHELSGGQRQRAMIAVAVANSPRLLIADEPTTALDPTIQAQILQLFAQLKEDQPEMGLIFVTHDLAVVAEIADRVTVMYAGEVVEEGPVSEVFERPRHPYTAALISSVPEGGAERLTAIPGAVPSPHQMPTGCRFAPRCGFATDQCRERVPRAEHPAPDRVTRCHRWENVT